jgi:hypothetical protein
LKPLRNVQEIEITAEEASTKAKTDDEALKDNSK